MKRIISVLICSLLLSVNFSQVSSAANKAGGSCKRINENATSGSAKLICQKSGKKLIWVNRADITAFAYGPTGRLVYRYVAGKQERQSLYKDWIKSDSRGEKSFNPIRVAAYKSIRDLKIDPSHSNIEFEYLIRPSYPKEIADVIKLQSVEFAKRLSPLLDKKLPIKLILVTEKDRAYVDSQFPSIVPNQDWQMLFDLFADYVTLERFYSRSGTGGGTAAYLPEKGYGYYIGHTSSLAKLNTYWPEVAPHEMTHVMQAVLANGFGGEYGEGDPRAKWHGHLIEGSANTFGMALGFDQLGWYSDEMDVLLKNNIRAYKSTYPMRNIDDALFLVKEIEKRDTQARGELSYGAGQFVWEYFVGKYGADKFIELLRNVPKTQSFDQNIKQTIGIEKSEFYQGAAEYLLTAWKRLS